MSFQQRRICPTLGAMTLQLADLVTVRCARCNRPAASHPATNADHRRRVLAMRAGALACGYCDGIADPATLREHGARWADPVSGIVYGPRYVPAG